MSDSQYVTTLFINNKKSLDWKIQRVSNLCISVFFFRDECTIYIDICIIHDSDSKVLSWCNKVSNQMPQYHKNLGSGEG